MNPVDTCTDIINQIGQTQAAHLTILAGMVANLVMLALNFMAARKRKRNTPE